MLKELGNSIGRAGDIIRNTCINKAFEPLFGTTIEEETLIMEPPGCFIPSDHDIDCLSL